MSGWMKTSSSAGSDSPIAASTVRGSPIRLKRSDRKPASARTISSLPNSDGWKRKKPRSIQRFDPRATVPARNTIANSASVPA